MPIDPDDTEGDGLLQPRDALRERLAARGREAGAGSDCGAQGRVQPLDNAATPAAIARATAEELEQVERLLRGLPARDDEQGDGV